MPARISQKCKSLFAFQFSEHVRRLRKKSTSLNFWIVLLSDIVLLLAAYFFSRYLRFDAFHLTKSNSHYIVSAADHPWDKAADLLSFRPV